MRTTPERRRSGAGLLRHGGCAGGREVRRGLPFVAAGDSRRGLLAQGFGGGFCLPGRIRAPQLAVPFLRGADQVLALKKAHSNLISSISKAKANIDKTPDGPKKDGYIQKQITLEYKRDRIKEILDAVK